MNKVILVGNVGQEPETNETANGTVTKFSVATSKKYKGEEKTSWHNIVTFNKLSELCTQYVKKGMKVAIDGTLSYNTWEDSEGNTKYKTEIIANEVQFLTKVEASEPAGII
jgi:single-strand DNA-binding protein